MSDQSDRDGPQVSPPSVPLTTDDPSPVVSQAVSRDASSVPKNRMLSALGDTLKAWLPPGSTKLGDKYGPAFFVGFSTCLIAVLVFVVTAWVQSDWVRGLLTPAPPTSTQTPPQETVKAEKKTGKAEKPSDIKFYPAERAPLFLRDYERLLGDFGGSGKPPGVINDPLMGVVVLEFANPTLEFNFSLRPRFEGSEINARLFRETMHEGRAVYEPLLPLREPSTSAIMFNVGSCHARDKLFMVVLIIPPSPQASGTGINDYFDTQVE